MIQEINAAINSYSKRILYIRPIDPPPAPPYDAASLAEIFEPRVRQLFELQRQGFTHVEWGYDPETKTNRWFGVEQ